MTQWEKKHWRIERRGIVRASVDADAIGFPEAAQVIAVKRECIELDPRLEDAKPEKEKKSKNKGNKKKYKNSNEKLFYISSLPLESTSDAEMLEIIRGHWTSIENGTHLMRDVSYDEDKCRISKKNGARFMAALRNLSISLHEFSKYNGMSKNTGLKSWCRQMTFSSALKMFCM